MLQRIPHAPNSPKSPQLPRCYHGYFSYHGYLSYLSYPSYLSYLAPDATALPPTAEHVCNKLARRYPAGSHQDKPSPEVEGGVWCAGVHGEEGGIVGRIVWWCGDGEGGGWWYGVVVLGVMWVWLGDASNSRLRNIVHCCLWVRVDCESNAIPVPPITAGSAKLSDWPIREAVKPRKITRGAYEKGNRKRGSHAEGPMQSLPCRDCIVKLFPSCIAHYPIWGPSPIPADGIS